MIEWIWVLWGSGYSDMSMLPHVTENGRDDDCYHVQVIEGVDSYHITDNPTTADIVAWLSGFEVWY